MSRLWLIDSDDPNMQIGNTPLTFHTRPSCWLSRTTNWRSPTWTSKALRLCSVNRFPNGIISFFIFCSRNETAAVRMFIFWIPVWIPLKGHNHNTSRDKTLLQTQKYVAYHWQGRFTVSHWFWNVQRLIHITSFWYKNEPKLHTVVARYYAREDLLRLTELSKHDLYLINH